MARRERTKVMKLAEGAVKSLGRKLSRSEAIRMRELIAAHPKKQFAPKTKHEPLSPRGKTSAGGGIRIPVRSQQSIAENMDRRRKKN